MSESPHLDITSTGQNSRTVLVDNDWLCAAFRLNCPVSLVSDSSATIARSKPWPAERRLDDERRNRALRRRTAHAALPPRLRDRRAQHASFRRDRNARSAESTLVPKVRIHFAEFPSLLSAVRPEAAHLGDLMRFLVRSRRPRIYNPLARIFTGPPSLPKATRNAALFGDANAFCGRPDSCVRSP